MNLKNILKRSKDLQKILLPAKQIEANVNFVQETKKMLEKFFRSVGNIQNLNEVEKIDITEIGAYAKLCDVLNSFVKATEEQIQPDKKDFKPSKTK